MVNVPVQFVGDPDGGVDGFEPILPAYGQDGDAGMDLRSRVAMTIPAHKTVLVPTGLKVAIPSGYVGLVHPRSGMSLKTPLRVANAPGTIDSGYRGEVCVIMENVSDDDFTVSLNERVAQLVLQKVEKIEWEVCTSLEESARGEGGFGSTGTH